MYVLDPPAGAGSESPEPAQGAAGPAPGPAAKPVGHCEWTMRANCSMSPGQLLAALGVVALASMTISLGFWSMGVPWVLPFACLEVLGLTIALLVYARYANDRETVRFSQELCEVECLRAGRLTHLQWPVGWTRVDCGAATGGLIELAGGRQRLRLGRHVRQAERARLARAMRLALQRADEWGLELK